jgi:hypothetical protein
MEFTMRDDGWAIPTSDWQSLTPAERSALTRMLIRQAHEARARAIGAALLRWPHRPRALRRQLFALRPRGSLARR